MVKKRGLGKSLDALLSYTSPETSKLHEVEKSVNEKLSSISVDDLQGGKYQPRREMDAESLEDLANSIRSQGIISPLIVRPVGDKYEIIAGERRWRAAQIAGLVEVPAIIRHIPDEAAMAIGLIENIQRENLNPIEEAIALQRLIEEFGMTHQQVAEAIGKSRTSVTNLLRLMTLPEEVKTMLEKRQLEMGHARTLITLPEAVQLEAAQLVVSRRLSVRETENLVKQLQSPQKLKLPLKLDPELQHFQDNLSRQLRMRVAIHHNARGRGKLVIHYKNLRELDELMQQFN